MEEKYEGNKIILFLLLITFSFSNVNAGLNPRAGDIIINWPQTDSSEIGDSTSTLAYFFDLRERETFIQLTYVDMSSDISLRGFNSTAHVQIFDVSNNCNENDFFDVYTPADTHVYNMRDIQTNDGNPSGVILPGGAYGIVVINSVKNIPGAEFLTFADIIGNLRILDNNGYEYRTNAQAVSTDTGQTSESSPQLAYTFNFNTESGITFSDIVGISISRVNSSPGDTFREWIAEPAQGNFSPFDIDILNINETIFSCRDIIFSCVDEDNPFLEELLSIAGTANVVSFEYGINNAITHSKGGELLCPGNNISEGVVKMIPEPYSQAAGDIFSNNNAEGPYFLGYVGLNNGNGRGSMDSLWSPNFCFPPFEYCSFF